MDKNMGSVLLWGLVLVIALIIGLAGCPSGSGTDSTSPAGPGPFEVTGTISGVTGDVVLQLNGAEQITVSQDGPFRFTTLLARGAAYEIRVTSKPTGFTATLTGASGTVQGHVKVTVVLAQATYTVGGNVTGLVGTLVLRNNGTDELTITQDGPFTFPTPLADGAPYAVTVVSEPLNQIGRMQGATGTVRGAHVTDVTIQCLSTWTIGGTITGLNGKVVLLNNGTEEITVSANGAFTFPTRQLAGTNYSVTVKTPPATQNVAIRNQSGTVGNQNVTTVELRCTDKVWTHPRDLTDKVSPSGTDVDWEGFDVAMDDAGNTIIVWIQRDGQNQQVFKSEYRERRWTHPANVFDSISPKGQFAYFPSVAMDNQGNAIIAWLQNTGPSFQVFKSEYRNGTWVHPTKLTEFISPSGQNAQGPRAAMDDNGNALIVWIQNDGMFDQVFKSEYRNGAWTHPQGLADNVSPDGQSAQAPRVAMDNLGNALIVWMQSDRMHRQAFVSEYRNGAWKHPAGLTDNISPDGTNVQHQPDVVMNDVGTALITWQQLVTGSTDSESVFLSEYRNGAWRHPASLNDKVSPPGGRAYGPRLALDGRDEAILTWIQRDGIPGEYWRIFASEYRGGVWKHPTALTAAISPAGSHAYFPVPTLDGNGNAVIAWYQIDATLVRAWQVFKSEYRAGAWTHPSGLADNISPDGQNAESPRIASGGNSDVAIVWRQSNGQNQQIYKSEYR
jgi:hypothetical protein